jgi:hypothetical protein
MIALPSFAESTKSRGNQSKKFPKTGFAGLEEPISGRVRERDEVPFAKSGSPTAHNNKLRDRRVGGVVQNLEGLCSYEFVRLLGIQYSTKDHTLPLDVFFSYSFCTFPPSDSASFRLATF